MLDSLGAGQRKQTELILNAEAGHDSSRTDRKRPAGITKRPITRPELTEAEIRYFLDTERLSYQKIALPFGLETPGRSRRQAKDIAFPASLQGKSVLDVGSCLGAFCIEALQRGAARAIGLELNRERIYQAGEIARFLGLNPEYIRADIEERPIAGPWDIVLCLNVLHHLRDPIGTLRYLALNTRERLVIEAASLGRRDARKHWQVGSRSSLRNPARWAWSMAQVSVLKQNPICYIGPYSPLQLAQTYFFTADALKRILEGHMRLFHHIEEIPSEHNGRYILRCTRLNIEHMVMVVGVCASGKSVLCGRIAQNEFEKELGVLNMSGDMSGAIRVSPPKIWQGATNQVFPDARSPLALYEYDLSLIEELRMYDYGRDPATDLLRCANRIDCVIVVPTREALRRQLIEGKIHNGRPQEPIHQRYLELYDRPGYLADLYSDWIDFCSSASRNVRFLLYTEQCDEQVLVPLSAAEAALRIKWIYR